jgi:tripartite-type tricarboxylate transporter receptor subunit TctC
MNRFLVVAALVLGAVPAAAQEAFPSRAVTIVNPYPPGGQADLSGRPFAAALQKVLKHRSIAPARIVIAGDSAGGGLPMLDEGQGIDRIGAFVRAR